MLLWAFYWFTASHSAACQLSQAAESKTKTHKTNDGKGFRRLTFGTTQTQCGWKVGYGSQAHELISLFCALKGAARASIMQLMKQSGCRARRLIVFALLEIRGTKCQFEFSQLSKRFCQLKCKIWSRRGSLFDNRPERCVNHAFYRTAPRKSKCRVLTSIRCSSQGNLLTGATFHLSFCGAARK